MGNRLGDNPGMRKLAIVVMVLSVGACAHRRPRGWVVSQTKNVSLYTDAWIEHEFMQEWLELSHAAYAALFPDVKTGKVDAVWLKNSGTRFYSPLDDPASGWTLERMPTGSGPIGREGLIVLERRDEIVAGSGPTGFTMRSVRDEAWAKSQMAHLFLMKSVPRAPLWLQVGLARYMSRFRIHYRGNDWLACFGSVVFDEPIRATEHPTVRSGRRVTIPMDQLTGSGWYEYERKRRYWYEYTAYALVHYLIHGERGFNKTRFAILLDAFRAGKSTEDALALAYPHILPAEWDERIDDHVHPKPGRALLAEKQYVAQGLCFGIPPAKAAEEKPRRVPADPRAVEVMLDDLDRVDPFHRHSSWMPQDIVEAEALKRPGRRAPGPTPRAPGESQPGEDRGPVPTVREPAAPAKP